MTEARKTGSGAMYRNMLSLLAVLALPSAAICQPTSIPTKKINDFVKPYLDADIFLSLSIGVVQDDQVWTGHFGNLSHDSDQVADDATLYEIGSLTKVFTGILLADAVESGDLKLDQSIDTLLPEVAKQNPAVSQKIQLVHLSTHVSGLPRMPDNATPADPTDPYADYGRVKLDQFMRGVKPASDPGTRSEYSNLAVGLLGDLLARHAETSYQSLLKNRIANPLAMTNTTLSLSAQQTLQLAPPHSESLQDAKVWHFDALAGAGAIRSNTADMIKFIRANLQPPDGPLGKAIELAWQQHQSPIDGSFAMGLGWHIARDQSTRWHNGQTSGYHAMLMINRELKAGLIVLCNTGTMEVDAIGESIIQMIAGMDVQPKVFSTVEGIDSESVARLVGEYSLFPSFVLTVRAQGTRLFVQATGQPEIQVYPKSLNSWFYKVVDAKLTFELPENGKATSVMLHQNGRDMKATRQGMRQSD